MKRKAKPKAKSDADAASKAGAARTQHDADGAQASRRVCLGWDDKSDQPTFERNYKIKKNFFF